MRLTTPGLQYSQSRNHKKGKLKIENFEIFEAIRKKQKGGTILGAHKALNPILIEECNGDFELLVVEVKIRNKEIRIMTGYGPQETWPEDQRMPFFLALEQEIVKAEMQGKSIIIEMDSNSKLGPEFIPQDPHSQSSNGKILAGIINRHGLIVTNGLNNKCNGAITRKRETKDSVEESIIDYVLISEDLEKELESITIDEKRNNCLVKIVKTKKGMKKIISDHKSLNKCIKKCFRKIRVSDKPNKEIEELFKQRQTLKGNLQTNVLKVTMKKLKMRLIK